ncbi:unnamed protein product, partial [Discosporangium mesarthrocarpum]
ITLATRERGQEEDRVRDFVFDHVFDSDAPQEIVYDKVGRPLVEDLLAGFNCTIFAYGQTGSGKTHTMSGPLGDRGLCQTEAGVTPTRNAGVIPRAIHQIFSGADGFSMRDGTREALYLEVYKEVIHDLLSPANSTDRGLRIRED